MPNKQILAYFGHHKCATVWVHEILKNVCSELSLKIEYVHSSTQFNRDLLAFIKENHIDFLTYANADINFVKQLGSFKGFHVIRDPRDLLVSSYFSHLYSHPTEGWKMLHEHREKLQEMPKEEGLILDMDFIAGDVFDQMYKWDYRLPQVMEIKMEDLTQTPSSVFPGIFEFLGIYGRNSLISREKVISSAQLKKILLKNRFAVLSGGRKPGEENQKHHFRKGVPGDWVNHFSTNVKKYFKEKYNDLLIELNYEKNTDW